MVKARINKLESDIEQAIATVNAIEGALKDCHYWLEILEKEESKGE